jgi:RNase adapter protein RapZ
VTLAGYEGAGKHYLMIAIGCTGGKHRSVAVAEQLAARLAGSWPGVQVTHRDLGRE